MQSKQQFARVAVGRLGCKTGHRTYGHDERGAIRLPSPAMAGLNPSSADGARPRPALLVANADAADLALTIHPHPTLSETVGLAAEAFEGTITDLYLPRKK
jgi:hypothetical protein